MKSKYFIIPAALLLAGAGCSQTATPVAINQQPVSQPQVQQAPQVQQPAAAQSPWRLAFNLPSGWRYAGDADFASNVPKEKPIKKADDQVFLVNTANIFYATGGMAPDWGRDPNVSNYTNATALRVTYGGPAGAFGKNIGNGGVKITENLYRFDITQSDNCKKYGAEYCAIPGTNGFTYLFKVGNSAYNVEMHTTKDDAATFKIVEDILKTATAAK